MSKVWFDCKHSVLIERMKGEEYECLTCGEEVEPQ